MSEGLNTAAWALDLGTSNTALARWDVEGRRPRLVELPAICRAPEADDPLQAPRVVPSATHAVPDPSFWTRLTRARPFRGRPWGREAWIGRDALERNAAAPSPAFALGFKSALSTSPLRTLARQGGRPLAAREVARLFLRELLAEAQRVTGERPRDIAVTAPIESFEGYRNEVATLLRGLGVQRVRFCDEPVAAALGYGLTARSNRHVLVVDMGGGTMHVALVALTARGLHEGACDVVAKAGRFIGGDRVDEWLLTEFCRRLDYPLERFGAGDELDFWRRMVLGEARRVKEAVYFSGTERFFLQPPEDLRRFEARLRGDAPELEVDRALLAEILTANGLYAALEQCLDEVAAGAATRGLTLDDVEDVLMVGGSTLLPGVYPLFEERFGRGRVRAWQPFEAVAWGAAAFAADAWSQSDYIVHDYAFVTYDATTHAPQYTVVVPRGTRVPSAPDLWKRKLVPTCSLGVPESTFKLVVCEIGRADQGRGLGFDAAGQLVKLGERGEALVIPLNEANPTLGELRPPHEPGDRVPRLEIAFGVNAERWLCASVRDLRSGKWLMDGQAVVRLL